MTLQHGSRTSHWPKRSGASSGQQGSESVESLAQRHPELIVLARIGWLAKGLVYGLVGVLAFKIALDTAEPPAATTGGDPTGAEASQSGAISEIARSSLGEIALWAVAIGLALYVLWRVVSILLPASPTVKAWATRAAYAISALVYAFLAFSAVSFARSGQSSRESENARVESFTRDFMDNSGGRWLVGLFGAVLVAIGVFFAYRAVTADFEDELEGGVGPVSREHLVRLGQIGWLGRAAMMGLIGLFLVRAAVQFDPAEAEGLDGALHRLAQTSWGPFAVAAVGVGLVLYGVYCVLSAPVQRLKSAD
jgi:hypothetical protein